MEEHKKTLVVVSGLECNILNEGHVIYLYKYLNKVLPIFKKIIVIVSETNGSSLKKLNRFVVKDELIENKVTGLLNFHNISILKKYQKHQFIIHFWYAPKIHYLPFFLKKNTTYYTFPDSWSSYYSSKYQLTRKKQFYLKSKFYKYLELAMSKHCYKTIYVSDAEAKENKGFVIPPLLENYTSKSEKNGILIGRMNNHLLDNLLSALTSRDNEFPITVINEDSTLRLRYKKFKNIKFEGWVEDYENFSSKFLIHLIYDEWASGMSTKLMNAINTNSLAVGNEAVFRGFPNVIYQRMDDNLFISQNLESLILNVRILIQSDNQTIMNLIRIQKEHLKSYIDNHNSISKLKELYIISP
tara:strand:+ start:516 stop:1583 length:1068 start_codon:yes stop_codon:yes gene_type:complete